MDDYGINSESYGQIKIEDSVRHLYETGDVLEQKITETINKDFYNIFLQSPYLDKYKKPKRIDSSDRLSMFYYFKNKLLENNKTYTNKDIFITFAEFFQVNYEQLYNEMPVLDKENLLRELNENEQYKNKIKSKRLF